MTDVEMLESIYNCIALDVRHDWCNGCKFNNNGCMKKRDKWLKEYIQKLKRQEDDLK